MEFVHEHNSRVASRSSLFMKSKKGGFGLVLILNLDNLPATVRCLRMGMSTNTWIRPEIVARSPMMGIMAVNCLRIMLSDIPDMSAETESAAAEKVEASVRDVMYTFTAVVCDGGSKQAKLDEQRLRNYLKSVKGSK